MRNIVLLSIILFTNCNSRNQVKQKSFSEVDTVATLRKSLQPHSSLKVAAYLIYDDGTLSGFDVLKDKSIALWNTIIGSGDAVKPSNSTKLNVSGDLDSLNIKIRNGRNLVIDTVVKKSTEVLTYIIKNTGCDEVYINISKNKNLVYNDTIPFHCGE